MADTLDNVTIEEDTWVDIYDATGIAVGTKIIVQNVGATELRLYSGLAPSAVSGYIICPVTSEKVNETGDAGAWVYSSAGIGAINVRIA